MLHCQNPRCRAPLGLFWGLWKIDRGLMPGERAVEGEHVIECKQCGNRWVVPTDQEAA